MKSMLLLFIFWFSKGWSRMRTYESSLIVGALELTSGLDDGEPVGEERRHDLVQKLVEFVLGHGTVGLRRPEEQLRPYEGLSVAALRRTATLNGPVLLPYRDDLFGRDGRGRKRGEGDGHRRHASKKPSSQHELRILSLNCGTSRAAHARLAWIVRLRRRVPRSQEVAVRKT
jgi:hypothetical protein